VTSLIAATVLTLVGLDGADFRIVTDMNLPNLQSLGEVCELAILERTETKPSWATILTPGLSWYVTGVQSNAKFRPIPKGWTIFEILESRGVPTAWVAEKTDATGREGNMCVNTTPQGKPCPFINVPGAVTFIRYGNQPTFAAQTDRCLQAIAAVRPDGFAFCHYRQPDVNGHLYGGGSPEYRADLTALDGELGRIIATGARVVVTSDHGFELADEPDGVPLDYRRLDKIGSLERTPYGRHHWHAERAIIVGADASVENGRQLGPWLLKQFP
jgi:hypothetical protein